MLIKSIAVIFDDRDKNNRGWYVRAFDSETAESSGDEVEIVNGLPRRRDAWKRAFNYAKGDLKRSGHLIDKTAEIRVYNSINNDLPNQILGVSEV